MGRAFLRQVWKEFGRESLITVFLGLLFLMLCQKVRSYIVEESEFQKQMYSDCIEADLNENWCKRMALDRLWNY